MKIKLSVFTGTRAEYGLMKTLISYLKRDNDFEFSLLVSGTHLNPIFGSTIDEIENDFISPIYRLPIYSDKLNNLDMGLQTAETIKVVTKALEDLKPKFLIILGDRFETFGAATAAHLLGIKIIHLHGGEVSLGAVDNRLRNAISQLSTFHFTSAEIHKKKVQDMVGSTENIYNVGPLVIDGLINLEIISKEKFEKITGFIFSKINFLITFHPETLTSDFGISGLNNLLKVLDQHKFNILFTSPNADKGSDIIIKKIKNFVDKNNNNYYYIPSLGQDIYLNALLLFDSIIGNSSSGIIEAPLLNKKVLNIGSRQNGRYKFGNVIDVKKDYISISHAVKNLIKEQSFEKFDIKKFKKFHINNSPSEKIIRILKHRI